MWAQGSSLSVEHSADDPEMPNRIASANSRHGVGSSISIGALSRSRASVGHPPPGEVVSSVYSTRTYRADGAFLLYIVFRGG